MSYPKQVWANGDVITAEKLNHIEEGIASVASEVDTNAEAMYYGAKWDKVHSKLQRTGLAAGITHDTTNFKHSGTVNANYANPFDGIFPWSETRLCNIDLDAYLALEDGDHITDCVIAWEGDADFSYEHENGVWKYHPEFYGRSFEDGGYRHFQIRVSGSGEEWVHYPEAILPRWRGVVESRTIDGVSKSILLSKVGMPGKNIAMSTLHQYAKNGGMTLDSIFSLDASLLMFIIEYADMNCQSAIGDGVDALYRENEADKFAAAATTNTVVKVNKANASAYCIPGAIFDIGTSKGGHQVGSYSVVSVETDGSDSTLLDVTLNEAVTVTTDNYWSVHGLINVADESIGSKSGYIGTNGKADAYYRGEVLWGNMFFYVLGAYHQKDTDHVFLAPSDESADSRDAINANTDYDTGIVLSKTNGYIGALGFLSANGLLACSLFCTEVGGSNAAPVGDYYYVAVASDTVLTVGGNANDGAYCGCLCGYWSYAASYAYWHSAARPRLKNP